MYVRTYACMHACMYVCRNELPISVRCTPNQTKSASNHFDSDRHSNSRCLGRCTKGANKVTHTCNPQQYHSLTSKSYPQKFCLSSRAEDGQTLSSSAQTHAMQLPPGESGINRPTIVTSRPFVSRGGQSILEGL